MSIVALPSSHPASAPAALPHNLDAEASVLGGIILRNQVLLQLESLQTSDFYDFKHRVVFEAMRNLEAGGKPIDVVTLETEIEKVGKLDALGGIAFLGELALRVPTPDNVQAYRDEVLLLSRNRRVILALSSATTRAQRWPHEASELLPELLGELEAVAEADRARHKATAPWRRCRDLVETILERATEPEVSLALGGDEVIRVRLGATVLLIGGTGRGKTSLAATLLVEHAKAAGPALAMSLELTADEWTARAIGTRCDTSWADVLRGEVPRDRMIQVLPERLGIVEREAATLNALTRAIGDLRREYKDEPILVAVDYAQLIGADSDIDIRPRIGRVMRDLDRVARTERVVVIALSQGSRASARALSSGERIGAETTDAGAEASDLERWATATLAIGQHGEPAEDGSCAAELSIGKSRMGGGDRVLPARYHGRSGLWRITGESRPAADVRAERGADRDTAKQKAAELAIVAAAERAAEPQTREALGEASAAPRAIWRAAVVALLGRGELVEVDRRRPRSRALLVWTRPKAESAGIPVVGDLDE